MSGNRSQKTEAHSKWVSTICGRAKKQQGWLGVVGGCKAIGLCKIHLNFHKTPAQLFLSFLCLPSLSHHDRRNCTHPLVSLELSWLKSLATYVALFGNHLKKKMDFNRLQLTCWWFNDDGANKVAARSKRNLRGSLIKWLFNSPSLSC